MHLKLKQTGSFIVDIKFNGEMLQQVSKCQFFFKDCHRIVSFLKRSLSVSTQQVSDTDGVSQAALFTEPLRLCKLRWLLLLPAKDLSPSKNNNLTFDKWKLALYYFSKVILSKYSSELWKTSSMKAIISKVLPLLRLYNKMWVIVFFVVSHCVTWRPKL